MSLALAIVDSLLDDEPDFDPKEMAIQLIRAPLTDAEFDFGFAIGTNDEFCIESNAADNAPPLQLNWDQINRDIERVERNLINAAEKIGIRLSNQGHSDNDLVGNGSVSGTAPGWPLIATMARMDEPMRTGSGTLPNELTATLYDGVSEVGARVIDVDFSIYDAQAIVDFLERHPMLDS
jgi:hypothetical protein